VGSKSWHKKLKKPKYQKVARAKKKLKFSYVALTLGLHIGDTEEDAELEKYVRAQAETRFSKKISAYLRHAVLVERAAGRSDAMSPDVLVELTRRLLGEMDAQQMARALEGKDQRLKLRRVLERMLHEEFDLDLYASDFINTPGEDPQKRLDEVAEKAGENFRSYYEARRLGKTEPVKAGHVVGGQRAEKIRAGQPRPEHKGSKAKPNDEARERAS
jgi:hypothetical protein